MLHVFWRDGAGDVKLFAAIASMTGAHLVAPMFFVVVLIGGLLGVVSMIRGAMKLTMMPSAADHSRNFAWTKRSSFAVPAESSIHAAIWRGDTFGSLLSLVLFRAW